MGANASSPPLSLSEYTMKDSDDNNFLLSHAYQVQKAGVVHAFAVDFVGASGHYLAIYVGLTSDPPVDGDLIERVEADAADAGEPDFSVSAHVAKGEFFELRGTLPFEPNVKWKNFGSLVHPDDFD